MKHTLKSFIIIYLLATYGSISRTSNISENGWNAGHEPLRSYVVSDLNSDDGIDETSGSARPISFATTCSVLVAPYTEDFETFTTSSSPFLLENCWIGSGGDFGDYFWESAAGTDTSGSDTGPSPEITTGNYFFTEASGGAVGDITDLDSPLVDLTGLVSPALMFNYHMFGAAIGTLEIIVNGTTTVLTISGQQQASDTAPWENAVIDLSAFTDQTISVTFRATRGNDFRGDLAMLFWEPFLQGYLQ